MILKAGTYRFNEVLDFSNVPINTFYIGNIYLDVYGGILNADNYVTPFGTYNGVFYGLAVDTDDGIVLEPVYGIGTFDDSVTITTLDGWVVDDYKDNAFTEDAEADDIFGTWYIANTNYNEINAPSYLAEITYNGETIAQLNAGETATIKCAEKRMITDIIIKINS